MRGVRRFFLGLLSVAVLVTPARAAQAGLGCEQWNTQEFFEAATVEDVTACLDAGADVKARDEFGYTPLHRAARFNEKPAVIEALLAVGANVKARDKNGSTPLHWAANPVIEALLAAGANIEARDEFGYTPLHQAAKSNEKPAVFEALLAVGANVKARAKNGSTPLHLAAENGGAKLDHRATWASALPCSA